MDRATDGAARRDAPQLICATEEWFLRRGIPHFIDHYRASEDVFTRTLPVLILIFLLQVLGAASLDWPWWQNTLALLGGAAVLVLAGTTVNRLRHRPPFQRPDDVGAPELTAFVLVPPLLPLLFGGQLGSAALTAAFNLVLLGVIYLVTSYGLLPMTRWAFVKTARQVGAVLDLFGRALPLLMLFSVSLFMNTEVWQVSASLDGVLFWVTITFFVLVGTAFLLLRLPNEASKLRDQLTGRALVEACAESPLARLATDAVEDDVAAVPLSKRQQGNVLLVLFFSQAVQILLVTVTIGAFFFLFGLIAIRPAVAVSWLGGVAGEGELASWVWFGRQMRVTRALLHVSVFLATLSGFYFTIYVITDSTYREEFFTEIVGEVRQSLAVRNVYLWLLHGHVAPPAAQGPTGDSLPPNP